MCVCICIYTCVQNSADSVQCSSRLPIISFVNSYLYSTQYWRDPFPPLCHPKQLTEYYVLDIEDVEDLKRAAGHGHISTRHCLADAWVVPSDMVSLKCYFY